MTSIATNSSSPKSPHWYRPTVSPEHGVYVMLIVSFLTGAAAAQQWTWATTLALICGFCGFQAEHPLVWQIKQRKRRQLRLLLWASLYGGVAGVIAFWFMWHNPHIFPLLLIYSIAIAALIFDVVSVWHRQQKSRFNEIVTFSAVCLLAPLAYTVTIGQSQTVVHLATDEHNVMRKLMALGIMPGSSLVLEQRFPSYIIKVGHTRTALDGETAASIFVE